RWAVFSHAAAVAVCASFSLADRGLLVNHSVSRIFYNNFKILLLPALLAWLLCPVVVVVSLARGHISTRSDIIGLIPEVLLCLAQMYSLLPACQ
ncbi:MAG TPA: hypothetical protein VGH74_11090, partial [Planctomycetaceae bacterium]